MGQLVTVDNSASSPIPVTPGVGSATTATRTSVASNVAVQTVLAANTSRKGATIYADGGPAYVALGSAATTTSYTVLIASAGYYEVPFGYTGIITAIWAPALGSLRVTEVT